MLARMWKPATALTVSAAQRADLEALVRSGKTPQRVVARALIVLAAAEGTPINAIARGCGMSRPTVYLWRDRFQQAGIVGLLKDAPRPGRRRAVSPDQVKAVVDATLHTTPPDATQWSVRTMAKAQGLSHPVVHRIWQAHGLQPHRVETFKLSRDPDFVKKLRDVVGVYLHPPAKALVLCVDEKPQVQALDRTEPVLPCGPGSRPTRPTTTSAMARRTCLAISEFPKWRKYLISLSFRGQSSVRPVQVGGFDVNIVIHRSTAVRGRGGPARHDAWPPSLGAILAHTDGPCGS